MTSAGVSATIDAGRGCPFHCSFCTIINVQGRVSRFRSADDLERIVRANHQIGIHRFFLTDDNLARNRNWEAIFDRIAALREELELELQTLVTVLRKEQASRAAADRRLAEVQDELQMARAFAGRRRSTGPAKRNAKLRKPATKAARTSGKTRRKVTNRQGKRR